MFERSGHLVGARPILRDLQSTVFEKKKRGSCYESTVKKDASTLNKLSAPVCLSVSRLTHIAPEALERRLLGLGAHEITHHFGFGEAEATQVQMYILENFDRLLDRVTGPNVKYHLMDMINKSGQALDFLHSGEKTNHICLFVGQSRKAAKLLAVDVSVGSNAPFKDLKNDVKSLLRRFEGISGFCGDRNSEFDGPYWVKEDDLALLEKLLSEASQEAEKIRKKVFTP